MSKYINAEKLYKKVDELMADYAKSEEDMDAEGYTDWATFYHGKRTTCSEVLNIITSLQHEPEVDLDGEIKKMCNSDYYKRHIKPSPYVIDVINYTAHYFYELGKNARKEE